MKLSRRLLAPVAAVAVVAVGSVVWLAGAAGLPGLAGPLGVALAAILAGTLLGAGLALRLSRGLSTRLDALARDFRAMLEGAPIPALTADDQSDEIGQVRARLRGLAVVARDAIATRAEAERLAQTDALTGLPNRRGLMDFLNAALQAPDSAGTIGVLHVDLDHFKAVNDTLGHQAGDFVLKEATRRMAASLRETDLLARLGGDEFIIVVPGVHGEAVLGALADRVIGEFDQPIQYDRRPCLIGASVGAAHVATLDDPTDARQLLHQADVALCHAKAAGRRGWTVFTKGMADRLQRQRQQAKEIREALLDGEFRAWFQPMIDLPTGAVTGIELLSRWETSERGLVLPQDFLPAAESHSMIEEIGMQVLERACRDIQRWQSRGIDVPKLHVNVTRTQLLATGAVDKITWLLDDCNVPPARVALEIGESCLQGRSTDLVRGNLRRFADLGIETVLDNFGAETGALGDVAALGARKIKCDRRLIRDLADPARAPAARAVLSGAVGLADRLGIGVLAKGVGDQAELAAVREIGFTEVQGDALAPAMAPGALVDWLPAQRPGASRALDG